VQVPLDGAGTEEEPRTDLRVRQAVASEPGDVPLLRSQFVTRLVGPPADLLARGQQLLARALGERVDSHRRELIVGGAELGARVDSAILAAQPLAVEQVRARQVHAHLGSSEVVECLPIQPLGGHAGAHERA
jgi:hypothetical protein